MRVRFLPVVFLFLCVALNRPLQAHDQSRLAFLRALALAQAKADARAEDPQVAVIEHGQKGRDALRHVGVIKLAGFGSAIVHLREQSAAAGHLMQRVS